MARRKKTRGLSGEPQEHTDSAKQKQDSALRHVGLFRDSLAAGNCGSAGDNLVAAALEYGAAGRDADWARKSDSVAISRQLMDRNILPSSSHGPNVRQLLTEYAQACGTHRLAGLGADGAFYTKPAYWVVVAGIVGGFLYFRKK
jgi:hypothetical protein